jgi:hypothetical protein
VRGRRFAHRRTLIARAASPLSTALGATVGLPSPRVHAADDRSNEVSDQSPLSSWAARLETVG